MEERKGFMGFIQKISRDENTIKRNIIYLIFIVLSFIGIGFLLKLPLVGINTYDGPIILDALSWIKKDNNPDIAGDFLVIQVLMFILIIIALVVGMFYIFKQLINLGKKEGVEKITNNITMSCVIISLILTIFSWLFPVLNSTFGAETFASVNLFPLIFNIVITLLYAIFNGCINSFKSNEIEDSMLTEEEQEARDILRSVLSTSRLELFLYSFFSIVLSILAVLSNILKVTYSIDGESKVLELVISGYDLIFKSESIVSESQRLLGFFAFVFFVLIIFSLFIVSLSYFKKSKAYYKIALGTIITTVSVTLLVGLLGQYYKIVQGINIEFIGDLLKGEVSNIDKIVKFEVESTSFIYFIGSCLILIMLFMRNPYTKASVVEQRIEAEDAARLPHMIELSDKDDLGKGSSTLSTQPVDACPAFTELDEKFVQFQLDLDEKEKALFDAPTLPKLVDFIVQYARDSRLHLYYTKEDIATFIAGLGTTKLSILQGMSGTGKTSLPKIVAEALYSVCDIVEVESSWRDKNELLGYYNEFNKVYTPKKFTQALYKAKLNSDVLTFIVLDEMNLSRIEYYFSDFLSLMENEPDKREIKLVNIKLKKNQEEDNEYYGLTEGHTLKIPNNVWFIGTANRDESTYDISDKVYDRAYTMNFDKRANKVKSFNSPLDPKYLSADKLNRLFEEAKTNIEFSIDNNHIIAEVEKLLKPYNISFGNRIAMQIENFVKIYAACFEVNEETINEALEIILLSKVVRKLELKNIEDKDELAQEFANLNLNKCSEFILNLKED